ncbi:hypothetical protein O3M35_002144 [Rhynocoris fuscipes]|uniref:Peptidase M12B domain-containing protein n=1 Tax=Rhynocoris fuscipes TaxID=488301 RepID=A0AAW1CQ29_9HEMI
MIVADNKMKEHHGNDLFSYVLTIMSVVSKIFKDASIGNRMTVALVNFSILQNQEYVLGKGNTNSSVMLTNFCHWQRKYNDPNDNSPQHHDTALLLTRSVKLLVFILLSLFLGC